jgi:hypothetical protein
MRTLFGEKRATRRCSECLGKDRTAVGRHNIIFLEIKNINQSINMNNNPPSFRSASVSWFLRGVLWTLFACLLLALPTRGPASTLGVNFLRGSNVGGTNLNALLSTDLAGAGAYAQVNWNNVDGALGTNVSLADSAGAASGVTISWASPNTWSQGGIDVAQGSPDASFMNAYLDNNGNANVAFTSPYNMFSTTVPANNNRNWPMVYLTGLQAWMTAQGVAAYDIVIYSDGDNAGGRSGEYWAVNANGAPDALAVGTDASTHVFICDLNNYIANPVFSEVPSVIQDSSFSGGILAQYGNFPGNYSVVKSLTSDTVLLRTQRYNSRAPINAIQIIPRATALPATFAGLYDARVFAGGKARFAPLVAGVTPMTFQWLRNGAPLSDGGNISGATTRTLTVSSVSAGDVASYSLAVTTPVGTATSSSVGLSIVTATANSYVEKVVTDNPVNYWRFNETQDPSTAWTPAYDAIGGCTATYGVGALNGFLLIPGPTPGEWPGFESGNLAYQSSRSGARQTYLMAPPLLLQTNTVTMCTWIYPTEAQGGFTALLSTRLGSDVAAFGYGNNNNLGYTWNSNSAATYNFVSNLVPRTNEWNFVAVAISATNAILYCYNTNGQLSATNAIAHGIQPCAGVTYLGGDPQGASIAAPTNRSFIGTIDEFAVFNQTLSPAEIYNLYKKGLGLNAIGPSIPNQPQSLVLMEGRTARFSVTASGDTPLTYRWRRNTVNLSDGGNISGATTPTLTVSGVTIAGDQGNYDVVVNNLAGSATSASATLTVVASNSLPAAYEAKLREYNPIAYWRLDETAGSQYAYDYWGGNTATNENVVLGVAGPQPPDFVGLESTNTAGQYASFSVADTATSVSLMNNRGAFSIIGWFNCPSLPIGNRVGLFGQNDVCEFGFHGNGPDGLAQVGIWTPSAGAYLNQSNIVANAWYLVAAVGSGTNVTLTLVSTNGGGGFQVLQASSAYAATTNYGASAYPFRIGGGGILDITGNYFDGLIDEVAVFDRALSVGELSDLFGAALTGGDLAPGISQNPVSQTLYAGRTAVFSVSAVGTTPAYQWRRNLVPMTDAGNISGSTTPVLSIANISSADAADYDVVITNKAGSVTSAPPATLAVITPSSGGFEATMIGLNPLAYYRLNETNDPVSGTAVAFDYWGGHNGLYASAVSNLFYGILGPQAPTFSRFETGNGAVATTVGVANSYVTAPFGSLSTNTVTMCMWVNPVGTNEDYAGLLVNRGSGVAGGFGYTGGQIGYTWNNNNANTYNFRSGLVPPLNQWSFVALVVTPTNAIVYMINSNGAYAATNEVVHTADVFGNNWQIGHDNNDGNANRTFNGLIDEVGVFTYALTPAQIQELAYSSGLIQPIQLSIYATGTNTVLLNWIGNAASYVIQIKTNLTDATWTDLSTTSSQSAVLPATEASSFFRVRSN